ncbi:MAG: hypothetical protein DRO87_06410 [Candidatus Thorarchaeota archaeon]|nr:MAG: hypothetical protein DRP09_06420 [Candidatus Thorarchaeota archaeon]RLI57925.1 MAG: hypothetical protein DRO87_06410 [Candidatus Thorarchaeota archaeon]
MATQANIPRERFMVYDARGVATNDSVYNAAIEMTTQVMDGLDRLEHSVSIETAILFITQSRAYLVLQAVSFSKDLINPAFGSTLESITYEPDTGYVQRYIIPILDY